MKATIKDIARETGLSITTVSLVLNDKAERISQRTKTRILEAARRLDYRPNPLAVGLLTRKTRTVGLILPEIRNQFFADVAKGAEDRMRPEGYSVILTNTDDDYELECECFRTLADRSVDGIIMIMSTVSAGAKSDEFMEMLEASRLPVILVDQFKDAGHFSTVAIDNFGASQVATRHLLTLGHRRIACIAAPPGPYTNEARLDGVTQTLREAGLRLEPELLRYGDFYYEGGYAAAKSLLAEKPTAIFCHNDLMAYGAMRAAADAGLRVPDDVSVMGFDDVFFSQYFDVPLTAIHQPAYRLGKSAADLLLDELEDPGRPKRQILYESGLVVRKSTAPPPAR